MKALSELELVGLCEQGKEERGSLVSGLCDQIVPFTYAGKPAYVWRNYQVLGTPGDAMKFKIWPLLIYNMCFFTVVYVGQVELSEKGFVR